MWALDFSFDIVLERHRSSLRYGLGRRYAGNGWNIGGSVALTSSHVAALCITKLRQAITIVKEGSTMPPIRAKMPVPRQFSVTVILLTGVMQVLRLHVAVYFKSSMKSVPRSFPDVNG